MAENERETVRVRVRVQEEPTESRTIQIVRFEDEPAELRTIRVVRFGEAREHYQSQAVALVEAILLHRAELGELPAPVALGLDNAEAARAVAVERGEA